MRNFIGIQLDTTPHKEKIISALGGFIGIFCILTITQQFITETSAALVVASMGASAVLLFAVPHGPLSQPWPLIGGHVVSACIGVSIRMLIPDMVLAAAMAVGISIGVMYYLRCIHPPGGATALAAVVSGEDVYALGYLFVLTPVLLNALVIMLTAFLVNYPFKWRRYPAVLSVEPVLETAGAKCKHKDLGVIPHRDLEYALKSMKSFADISEEELALIYQKARQHNLAMHLSREDIKLGCYYIHGQSGGEGVVRRVIDESSDADSQDLLIYKVITGPERQTTATTTREEFARWARHEVVFDGEQWNIKT